MKTRFGNQAAGDVGWATEHDRVPLLCQLTGNRQGPRQQAEIIGRQGREKERRHDQSVSHSARSAHQRVSHSN